CRARGAPANRESPYSLRVVRCLVPCASCRVLQTRARHRAPEHQAPWHPAPFLRCRDQLERNSLRVALSQTEPLTETPDRFEILAIVPRSLFDVVDGDGKIVPRRQAAHFVLALLIRPRGLD